MPVLTNTAILWKGPHSIPIKLSCTSPQTLFHPIHTISSPILSLSSPTGGFWRLVRLGRDIRWIIRRQDFLKTAKPGISHTNILYFVNVVSKNLSDTLECVKVNHLDVYGSNTENTEMCGSTTELCGSTREVRCVWLYQSTDCSTATAQYEKVRNLR